MDIWVDLNSRAVHFGSVNATEPERVKIRQTEDIRLKFHRGGVPELIAASDAIFLGLKLTRGATATLAEVTDWTHPGSVSGFYTAALNLNTTQITTDLFDLTANADLNEQIVFCEITRTPSGGTVRRYDDPTQTLSLTRSTFTGDEGTPSDATTPTAYSTTEEADARYLRWLSAVTGLTGGGSTKLDGLTTTTLTAGQIVFVVISSVAQMWQLQAVSTAENASGGIVRPDDYNASTNLKTWIQIL